VKIDTEGFELQVVLGAQETLETCQPMVLFESNTAPERTALLEAFKALGFGVYRLNTALFESPEKMSGAEFLADEKTNFMALHAEHPMLHLTPSHLGKSQETLASAARKKGSTMRNTPPETPLARYPAPASAPMPYITPIMGTTTIPRPARLPPLVSKSS
jgi:hypothetical protein